MTQPIHETGTLAFTECCMRVIRAASRSQGANLQFAASYAQAGKHTHSREFIRVQALYILNNLSGWRGDEARMVKAQLKEFADQR